MNYIGRNICLSISRPPIRDTDLPTIKTEMALGNETATHVISVRNFGSVTVEESPQTEDKCAEFPRDKFDISKNSEDRSSATFCVTNVRQPTLVKISFAAPNAAQLDKMEQTLLAVSSCQMERHSGIYVYGDMFKVGPIILGHRRN